MTKQDLEQTLASELHRIAPDIGLDEIDREGDLREEFDIDSMDFLTLVTALGKQLRLDMPEADYPRMSSFDAFLAYLEERVR